MIHLPLLIQDLGFILITAAIAVLIFKKLKQPVVLGYLLAGFLMSSHVHFLPTVKDPASIHVWAEIGVIFLLFGLGLEFSFKKLAQVGKAASITATFEISFMIILGYFVGQIFGWSNMDSLFLGAILSMSSTTIIVRAFNELDLKGLPFVNLVFGILIVEDLMAILILVLLSTVAATQAFSGMGLVVEALRLGFFLFLWFAVGIYLLPIFLEKIKKYMNDETTLVVSIALCLMMVMIATYVGFSPALGAFVMGSLIAETKEGKKIEHLLIPVRDLFAAVFFVSVGMMIDPNILSQYFWIIILITAITILGKILSTTIGALISGRSLKHSTQAGLSLAQIGEFSFIIATLGVTLKVTSSFLYPIAVAVSAMTTLTTPYLIKCSEPFYNWFEKKLPHPLLMSIRRYEKAMTTPSIDGVFKLLWREYGLKTILNSVIIYAISFGIGNFLTPKIFDSLGLNPFFTSLISCIITIILCAPFLWAIVIGPPSAQDSYHPEIVAQLRRMQFGLGAIRVMIGMILVAFIVHQFSTLKEASVFFLVIITISGLYFSKYAGTLYKNLEDKFISNLNENEKKILEKEHLKNELAPWDAVLGEFALSPYSNLVAKTLAESRIKEDFGVTLTLIARGEKKIFTPGRNEILLPHDHLYLVGNEEQLKAAKKAIEVDASNFVHHDVASIGLESVLIGEHSLLLNKSIRESGIREEVNGLIVGIERGGIRILSPDSSLLITKGDLLLIVGELKKIRELKKKSH